jgi:hypothetical protein
MTGKSLFAAHLTLILSTQISWAQWTITTSGQVGIGITSPNANSKLHVQHTDFYAGYFTSNKASSTTKVLRAEYTGTGSYNAVAIYGKSAPVASYGWGGFFEGGLVGVAASSTISGSGIRTGVNCAASGGSTANYGILSSGSGGSTNYAGYFSGNVTVTGTFSNPSDDELKENVDSLRDVLPSLTKLRPISFDFKKTSDLQHMNLAAGKQFGFSAQELEAIFPELVHTERHPSAGELEGREGEPPISYKSVNYLALIPMLVEAIKEQQEMIEQLRNQLNRLGQE